MHDHDHGGAAPPKGNGPDYNKFGLVGITLSYHYQGQQWEVELDPHDVDIMIFGWANYEKYKPWLPGPAGGSLMNGLTHLMPDGTLHADRNQQWPKNLKVKNGPRAVGPAFGGSVDDFCWHDPVCLWWCVSDTHMVPSP